MLHSSEPRSVQKLCKSAKGEKVIRVFFPCKLPSMLKKNTRQLKSHYYFKSNFGCYYPFLLTVSQQGENQRRLYRELLKNYNRLERPVVNDSQPLVVELQLSLLQIIDVVSWS